MASVGRRLDAATTQDDLLRVVDQLNADPAVHGILVQLPLPARIESRAVIEAIHPAKDVDGFHPINVGRLASGEEAMVPCTPAGVMELLHHEGVELEGADAVVVGRGGLRVRVPVARLRPDRDAGADATIEQAVTIRATTPADAPGELDLRGRTAQEAREAVRVFVDTAALAGRFEVRVIHGRGTGAVRAAVRDELARHPLVVTQEPDSADGATLVRLGAG